MDADTLTVLADATQRQIYIVTSSLAYAVAAIENDPQPRFQLGTMVRMGLSDHDAADPDAIARMRYEYTAWVIGHALADISEAIATFLNELVRLEPRIFECTERHERFERLGLDLKLGALPALVLAPDYRSAVESVTKARNCLTHRHGVVADRDCNVAGELVLTWRGIKLSRVQSPTPVEVDPAHRGPVMERDGDAVQILITSVERRFSLGSRVALDPYDLCTLAWCIQGVVLAIHQAAAHAFHLPDPAQR